MAERCGYKYYHFTRTTDKSGGDYGYAFLSRFPIQGIVEEVEFKEQYEETRKYSRAVLEIDGQEVAFYNTHFCTQKKISADGATDSTSGQKQFIEVIGAFQGEKIPALMTGDFNLPFETQIKLIDRSKTVSMNGGKDLVFTHEKLTIDNIYMRNTVEYYVDEDSLMSVFVGNQSGSDHKPLWSYFKIKE